MDKLRRSRYLEAIGIDVYTDDCTRQGHSHLDHNMDTDAPTPNRHLQASGCDENKPRVRGVNADWQGLQEQVVQCQKCSLAATRTQTVFGVGSHQANWLVIGEAPGADEDEQGEPFVGRAGKLLNEILWAAGQPREKVYIANILKCRPPNNRDPLPEEVNSCQAYLNQQVRLLNPKIILCVGRIAAQNLLQVDTPIGKMRGLVHYLAIDNKKIPVIVMYHPAYLLRSPREKRKVWLDMQLALKTVEAVRG